MKYIVLRSFDKKLNSYNEPERGIALLTLKKIKDYLKTGRASYGLRIKKLSSKIYEGRINIHLRIAYFRGKGVIKFFCLGNHDDIKHCLKTLRQRFG